MSPPLPDQRKLAYVWRKQRPEQDQHHSEGSDKGKVLPNGLSELSFPITSTGGMCARIDQRRHARLFWRNSGTLALPQHRRHQAQAQRQRSINDICQ